MNLLLDTHIAIWLLEASPKLPARALGLTLAEGNDLYVSDVSAWEVARMQGCPYPPTRRPASSACGPHSC